MINKNHPELWKSDIAKSVDLYNDWFMHFAPRTFRETRKETSVKVEDALKIIDFLRNLTVDVLKTNPSILPILRMATCPPIAKDRLVGLSGASKSLVENMEDKDNPRLSSRKNESELNSEISKITSVIKTMYDPDIFSWISNNKTPTELELFRASTIIADRLCGAVADPIIRNAQEKRQLKKIEEFLFKKGYSHAENETKYNEMPCGTFSFRTNVPVLVSQSQEKTVNIPVDVLIKPYNSESSDIPVLIEAKSAGDFANVNKRRKEEAVKMQQLKNTFGENVSYNLFLCGYFDSGYLGYEAAEGIDWIWEHKIEDMEKLGI